MIKKRMGGSPRSLQYRGRLPYRGSVTIVHNRILPAAAVSAAISLRRIREPLQILGQKRKKSSILLERGERSCLPPPMTKKSKVSKIKELVVCLVIQIRQRCGWSNRSNFSDLALIIVTQFEFNHCTICTFLI